MRILSHRGYWQQPSEKNRPEAFCRSFSLGFGTETDVRDCGGRLVVSHDPPAADAYLLDDLLALRLEHPARPLTLALNIKADGLAMSLRRTLEAAGVLSSCFVFDMSVPDMLDHFRHGLPVFSRQSELEREIVCYDRACGVWMDCFYEDWFDLRTIDGHLSREKQVCLVSPDLHRRDPRPLWDRLAAMPIADHPGLMLCTDSPVEAASVFNQR